MMRDQTGVKFKMSKYSMADIRNKVADGIRPYTIPSIKVINVRTQGLLCASGKNSNQRYGIGDNFDDDCWS